MNKSELTEVLDLHKKWLECKGGSGANLSMANLSGADLSMANLRNAKNIPSYVFDTTNILPQGDLIGWKKAVIGTDEECLVKLLIPSDAKRSNATGRKCRCEFAKVLGFETLAGDELPADTEVESSYDNAFVYPPVGEILRPDDWDDNRWEECSNGIHFFITRSEAERY